MLVQEKLERMDWLTYGHEQREEGWKEGFEKGWKEGFEKGMKIGARKRLEQDAKGMYAKGLKPEQIARIQGITIETVEEILGLHP